MPSHRHQETIEEELEQRVRAMPAGSTDADVLQLKREIYERRHAELQAMLQEGIDQADRGEVSTFNVDEFLEEAARRKAAREGRRETA